MHTMRTVEEIRHTRLLELLAQPEFPTIQSLADRIERSHAQVSQWKNKSKRSGGGVATIESATARHIEEKTGHARGWMDTDPDLLRQASAGAPFGVDLMARLTEQPAPVLQAIEPVIDVMLTAFLSQGKVVQLGSRSRRSAG